MASDSPFQTLDFSVEGRMALQDVAFALKEGILSSSLPCSQQIAYLNLTTQEGDRFCVELTSSGFKVGRIIAVFYLTYFSSRLLEKIMIA